MSPFSSAVPPVAHEVLRSPGRSLDPGTRAFMEPRFGNDFSQVRVHADAKSAESARAVNALAYTVGRDIVFGTGQYTPGTNKGQRLLAHELTHVVQQGGAGTLKVLHLAQSNDVTERELDRSGPNIQTATLGPQLQKTSACDADYDACVTTAGEALVADMAVCASVMAACATAAALGCAGATIGYAVCLAIALAACALVELACLAKARTTFDGAMRTCERNKANCSTAAPVA